MASRKYPEQRSAGNATAPGSPTGNEVFDTGGAPRGGRNDRPTTLDSYQPARSPEPLGGAGGLGVAIAALVIGLVVGFWTGRNA